MYRVAPKPSPIDLNQLSLHTNYDPHAREANRSGYKISIAPRHTGREGLHTPPADDMSMAYSLSQFDEQQLWPKYQAQVANVSHKAPAYGDPSGFKRSYATLSLPPLETGTNLPREITQSQTLVPQTHPIPSNVSRRKGNGNEQTQANLIIPISISPEGGNLADFAAQITCLFWFESIEILNEAECMTPSLSIQAFRPEALPTNSFRKWVATILSTTQVTDKVIVLALLFIYRLKTYNPTVKGRSGSEYRLLTVALMLGNKFLDDNTYTNNTWAEVSGISVQEIHVMEVEFLSNMRYSLLASKEQWDEWHQKLRRFKHYCDESNRVPLMQYSLPPMPSPPESTRALTPPTHQMQLHMSTPGIQWSAPIGLTPSAFNSVQGFPRKRSIEYASDEPPCKKISRSINRPNLAETQSYIQPDMSCLPVPNLMVSKNITMNSAMKPITSQTLVLPPLGSLPSANSRTPSSMYVANPTTPSWAPPSSFNNPGVPFTSQHNYSTPSRHASPHCATALQDLRSYNTSPNNSKFSTHPGHISPSIFLQQRSSPYKPIRNVQTLLYPPSFGSSQENFVCAEEMRYRPLGKKNENIRSGVVPHWPVQIQSQFR
ncbi:BgTH12-07137 [Blumeria graminis f. sp. triticale]|uniref:BgTH12-07137 n=1 Tax=Blumeria graminis f. sp. triticale TaxID=1689686 RepID=A0A9W4GJS9_BLUGR|nr:BgTH12-07137 [Blumeria graminis f. sp. triticale]